MRSTFSRGFVGICVGILILTFLAMVASVTLTVLQNGGRIDNIPSDLAGTIVGAATALCVVGWFLAMENIKAAEREDATPGVRRAFIPEEFMDGNMSYVGAPVEGVDFFGGDQGDPAPEETPDPVLSHDLPPVAREGEEIPESEWL